MINSPFGEKSSKGSEYEIKETNVSLSFGRPLCDNFKNSNCEKTQTAYVTIKKIKM